MASYDLPVLKLTGGKMTRAAICARIATIDQIIDAYTAAMLLGASSSSIVEYELHTGQTKERVQHAEPQQLINGLKSLQDYRDFMASKLTPRRITLIPIQAIKPW